MRKLLFKALLVVSLMVAVSCNSKNNDAPKGVQEENATVESTTQMVFESTTHDFGTINAGPVLTHKFPFKNNGNVDLVIKNVVASCGCTVPKWTKEPIKPGESSEIEVHFNSAGRFGGQHKTVRIYANIPETEIVLTFTAEIVNPEEK